jgi:hypothetical protein
MHGITVMAWIVVFLFLSRSVSALNSTKPWAQGLAYVS